MRPRTFASAAAATLLVAAMTARTAHADDGPMSVPITAPGFGNLAGFEGGNAGGERGGANYRDTSGSAHRFDLGAAFETTPGIAVYRAPSAATYYLRPEPAARSTTGMSSYETRPYSSYSSYASSYRCACPPAPPAYRSPCSIPRR